MYIYAFALCDVYIYICILYIYIYTHSVRYIIRYYVNMRICRVDDDDLTVLPHWNDG